MSRLSISSFQSPILQLGNQKMIEEKIQKTAFEVGNLHDPDDVEYWKKRSYQERIETIEFLRKAMFGHDRVSERLQRVLTIAELKEN